MYSVLLQDISATSPEFKEVETQFKAGLNNHIKDYVKDRLDKGQFPITFLLKHVTRISNDHLSTKFQQQKEVSTVIAPTLMISRY